MYYAFSFLNLAKLKGKLKYSIKTDILLTHAGHASLLMVGPIISARQEVGPIIFLLPNFDQMHNLVIFISIVEVANIQMRTLKTEVEKGST